MAVFFSQIGYKTTEQWKEEIVMFDPGKASAADSADGSSEAVLPDGRRCTCRPIKTRARRLPTGSSRPRIPGSPATSSTASGRGCLGRGIIHEPDDIRPDNPPANPELLAFLERELVAGHYDLKHVYRLILNSRPTSFPRFPQANIREADGGLRALCAAPAGGRGADRRHLPDYRHDRGVFQPDSRAFHVHSREPAGDRAGRRQHQQPVPRNVRPFGARHGLESERNNRPTAAQQLHMLNSSHIRRKIEQSAKLRRVAAIERKPREIIDDLYLTILSRPATAEEAAAIGEYAQPGTQGQAADDGPDLGVDQ